VSQQRALIENVIGEQVSLGPLRRDLIPVYQRWNNDLATGQTLGLSWPTTLEQETQTYEHRVAATDKVCFTIYERASGEPVGLTYLYDISDRHARASLGIIIGETGKRGKGYGTEATRLALDYAFNAYGLENVMLTVLSFNLAGIRAYEKAGFKEFGRRRKCSRIGGRLWDLVHMDCIAGEFTSPHLSQFLYDQEDGSETVNTEQLS
jgi:diamine N-acetyltransferase